jgi:hypothetical protein
VKSFLIQAGADGEQVIRQLADTSVTADAVSHAADLGYSVKVTDGIDREVARRTARSLDDLGKAREPKASNELAEAARRSDEEFRAAERRKIQDREASAGW